MTELRQIIAKLAAGIDAAPTATEQRSAGAPRQRSRTRLDDGEDGDEPFGHAP
jgi:hypothetical protein